MPVLPSSDNSKPQPPALRKKAKALVVAGLILVIAGGVMNHYMGGQPKADAQLSAQCRQALQERGAAGILDPKRCDEKAFAIQFTAQANGMDADAAARAISSVNQSQVGGHMMSMLLLGIGLCSLLLGCMGLLLGKRQQPS